MDFQLHNSFTFWISRLASVMQEQFNKELDAQDVTWPQWMVMNVLAHKLAETPAQIADNLGVDRSAITRLVDRLEKKNLVARAHDSLDRRSIHITLTRSGAAMVAELDRSAGEHQERFLSQLHNTEYRAFKGNLQKMLRAGGVDSSVMWKHV